MRLQIARDEREFARLAADLTCNVVAAKRDTAIGLPSGKTPLGVYDELARRVRHGRADLSGVTAFAIDELHGLPPDHPATNASYFRWHLTERVPLRAFLVMDSASSDPQAECNRFSRLIAEAGGLDLAVLGIGANGHIAFNEPGSPLNSRGRRVPLKRETRDAYAAACGSFEATPTHGLTLGIADLLEARQILLLASGQHKAPVVARALQATPSETVPASALRRHLHVTVLLDEQAASTLRNSYPKR